MDEPAGKVNFTYEETMRMSREFRKTLTERKRQNNDRIMRRQIKRYKMKKHQARFNS